MRLYNTLSKKIEDFVSISEKIDVNDKRVKMYSCGPTVYNHAHIGNLRAFTFADLLKKALQFENYKVEHVMNITDFGHLVGDNEDGEDKMSLGLKRENLPRNLSGMKELADKYTDLFLADIDKLNIQRANKYPRASAHINIYIKIIEDLLDKNIAYKISDGIYFDTSTDADYGAMSNLDFSHASESRIGENNEKRDSKDFALWKFQDKSQDEIKKDLENFSFPAPFGYGFPGWHIECSGMVYELLGETIDIHTGGVDHVDVHHTNEIAQSESFTGHKYSNFFCHCEFLNINNAVMSKSKDNFLTLNSIIEKGYSPLAFRYFLLQSHYRQNTNFTQEALEASAKALTRLKSQMNNLELKADKRKDAYLDSAYLESFKSFLFEDLNIPKCLALAWEMLKDMSVSDSEKYWVIREMDRVFSLGLDIKEEEKAITEEVQELIEKREIYRKEKNWIKSDEIRDILINLGYKIEDK